MRTPLRLFRLAVVGSRGFRQLELVQAALEGFGRCLVVSGGASGVDTEAECAADRLRYPKQVLDADWDLQGPEAGAIRNREIIDLLDAALVFWDGRSPGTRNFLYQARILKKPLILILDSAGKITYHPENWDATDPNRDRVG